MAGPLKNMQDAVGMRAVRDIFNEKGMLLIPEQTIILDEHLAILSNHGVQLMTDDIADANRGTYDVAGEIEHAVDRVSTCFDDIRILKKIPLAEMRQGVLPIIQETCSESTLYDLFHSLQAKDDYTYRHNLAVATYSNLLGSWLGLGKQEILQLTTAALLHDVGKMLVPDHILNKPGRLSEEEFQEMRNHTVYGYNLLMETPGINERQALVALQHHERLDGSGYPYGRRGDQIDLFSRIVAVADVFHAMTSDRVYRVASPFYEVLLQMERDTYGALDPKLTNLFIQKLMSTLIGENVLLTDDRRGVILMINQHNPVRPFLQVEDDYIDLSKDFTVHIRQIL